LKYCGLYQRQNGLDQTTDNTQEISESPPPALVPASEDDFTGLYCGNDGRRRVDTRVFSREPVAATTQPRWKRPASPRAPWLTSRSAD
jgi:hypothetical protein